MGVASTRDPVTAPRRYSEEGGEGTDAPQNVGSSDSRRRVGGVVTGPDAVEASDASDAFDAPASRVSVEDLVPPVKPVFPKSAGHGSASSSSSSTQHTLAAPSSSSYTSGGASTAVSQSRKRKPKVKSLFPVLSREANKGKPSLQADILDLTALVTGQGDSGCSADRLDQKPHLGLYTDRLGTHRCLLQESEHHLSHENMEYHLQLELWRGNVAGALQIARQRNELSDWIVAMAPLASHELWEVVCVEYAEQLEEEGHYHKAASYLLAGHRTLQAIELFRNHRLFKEAVSLARIRLSPVDPLLEDLYTEWGQNLMKDGQFEQAAKCYLAMRQIQEASKVLARRNDQSSLMTACQMSLLAKEEHLGVEYAFQVFSQHLMAGEWKDAYSFVQEHKPLKALLPLLSTHELLTEQLSSLCPGMALTQKPLNSSSFGQWGNSDRSKNQVNLPDFLINKSDTDPAVPWEPLRVSMHTFPHHVLRHWYYCLDMNLVSSDLRATYNVMAHLLELQKSFADIPQSLVVLSTQLTLCFISLLLCETSSAVRHLLQAVSFLHQNDTRGKLLCSLCQLVLPQGPKYLLKLQQEFNASRLVINMESHGGDLEKAGGEAHTTIKKYLSDIKDDKGISSAGSRCREMDCLRAYYYLAVLEHLNEEYSRVGQHGEDDGMPHHRDDAPTAEVKDSSLDPKSKLSTNKRIIGPEDSDSESKGLAIIPPSPTLMLPSRSSDNLSTESFSSPVDPSFHVSSITSNVHALDTHSNSSAQSKLNSGDPTDKGKDPEKSPSTDQSDTSSSSDSKSVKSQSLLSSSSSSSSSSTLPPIKEKSPPSYQKWKLTRKNLLHLSKGVLWDVQAKREALTETLGYIHRAISQHLLTTRADSSTVPINAPSSPLSPVLNNGANPTSEEDGGCQSSRTVPAAAVSLSSPTPVVPSPVSIPPSPSVSSLLSPPQPQSTSSNGNTITNPTTTTTPTPTLSPSRPNSQEALRSLGQRVPITRSLSETVTSRRVGENRGLPLDVLEVRQKVEQELLGIVPSAPTHAAHKNRKVFWRDSKDDGVECGNESHHVPRPNPDGPPIPLEWTDLSVDVKYTQPYVSHALLKQEQEAIAAELKQVPDMSKIPFPTIHRCTKTLLEACVCSVDLNMEEKRSYMKELKDWSLLFAVTSFGKYQVEQIFSSADQQQLQHP